MTKNAKNTNATANVNAYYAAFETRIAKAKANVKTSKSNITKLEKLQAMTASQAFAAMLETAQLSVDAVANNAIYEIEKTIKLAHQAFAFNIKTANENTFAMLKAVFAAHVMQETLTKDMLYNALLTNRSIIQDEKTLLAQSQTSRKALENLHIIKERSDLKNAYEININEVASALAANMNIDLTISVAA